jgi:hypothetical protein
MVDSAVSVIWLSYSIFSDFKMASTLFQTLSALPEEDLGLIIK